jgi:hypothetical protein
MSCFFRLKPWLLGLSILVVAFACGCGSGDSQTDSIRSGPAIKAPDPAGGPQSGARVKGQNFCKSAVASAGPNPRAVQFVARCTGQRLGKIVFTLVGYSIKDGARLKINSYTQAPAVKGPGAVSQQGKCSIRQDIIACRAKINGPVAISGRFQVSPMSRCSAEVSLVSITYPPCRAEACSGGPVFDELFSDKPQGCGGTSS